MFHHSGRVAKHKNVQSSQHHVCPRELFRMSSHRPTLMAFLDGCDSIQSVRDRMVSLHDNVVCVDNLSVVKNHDHDQTIRLRSFIVAFVSFLDMNYFDTDKQFDGYAYMTLLSQPHRLSNLHNNFELGWPHHIHTHNNIRTRLNTPLSFSGLEPWRIPPTLQLLPLVGYPSDPSSPSIHTSKRDAISSLCHALRQLLSESDTLETVNVVMCQCCCSIYIMSSFRKPEPTLCPGLNNITTCPFGVDTFGESWCPSPYRLLKVKVDVTTSQLNLPRKSTKKPMPFFIFTVDELCVVMNQPSTCPIPLPYILGIVDNIEVHNTTLSSFSTPYGNNLIAAGVADAADAADADVADVAVAADADVAVAVAAVAADVVDTSLIDSLVTCLPNVPVQCINNAIQIDGSTIIKLLCRLRTLSMLLPCQSQSVSLQSVSTLFPETTNTIPIVFGDGPSDCKKTFGFVIDLGAYSKHDCLGRHVIPGFPLVLTQTRTQKQSYTKNQLAWNLFDMICGLVTVLSDTLDDTNNHNVIDEPIPSSLSPSLVTTNAFTQPYTKKLKRMDQSVDSCKAVPFMNSINHSLSDTSCISTDDDQTCTHQNTLTSLNSFLHSAHPQPQQTVMDTNDICTNDVTNNVDLPKVTVHRPWSHTEDEQLMTILNKPRNTTTTYDSYCDFTSPDHRVTIPNHSSMTSIRIHRCIRRVAPDNNQISVITTISECTLQNSSSHSTIPNTSEVNVDDSPLNVYTIPRSSCLSPAYSIMSDSFQLLTPTTNANLIPPQKLVDDSSTPKTPKSIKTFTLKELLVSLGFKYNPDYNNDDDNHYQGWALDERGDLENHLSNATSDLSNSVLISSIVKDIIIRTLHNIQHDKPMTIKRSQQNEKKNMMVTNTFPFHLASCCLAIHHQIEVFNNKVATGNVCNNDNDEYVDTNDATDFNMDYSEDPSTHDDDKSTLSNPSLISTLLIYNSKPSSSKMLYKSNNVDDCRLCENQFRSPTIESHPDCYTQEDLFSM